MTVMFVDAGPRQISRSVEVDAPTDELFAIVADRARVIETFENLRHPIQEIG